MLRAVVYARFHTRRGPSVIHQHPHDAILLTKGETAGLFNWSDISSYIMPSYDLCNRPLSVCVNGYRVLGFPVSLEGQRYELTERNRFTFNVCFVLAESDDAKPWEPIVSKMASFFIDMEESTGLLQAEEQLDGLKWAGDGAYPAMGVGRVYELLRSTFTQMNLYGDTCVGVGSSHELNLRLASPKHEAPEVMVWEVPLLTRALPDVGEWTWDLTLKQIFTHIDGVNHIQRIAELADVEVGLVGKTVRELLRHQRAMLLDVFHFQAIYTLTADFEWFIRDEAMWEECARYVAKDQTPILRRDLIELYRALGPGTTVKEICLAHRTQFCQIDVRRFITFGVIKGLVRRVHKFALSFDRQDLSSTKTAASVGLDKERDQAWKQAAFSSGWATPPTEPSLDLADRPPTAVEVGQSPPEDIEFGKFLDGKHCLDEICVSLHLTETQVLEKLRAFGETVVFSR